MLELRSCPVCALDSQRLIAERDYGDRLTFECERCGRFTIAGTAEVVAQRAGKSPQLAAWIRERNLLGVEVPILTTPLVKEIIENAPNLTPLEKQQKLMKAVSLRTEHPGREVLLMPDLDWPLAWAANEVEFQFYIAALVDRGLLAINNPKTRSLDDPLYPMVITAAGWDYLDAEKVIGSPSIQAFVAMSFEESLLPIFNDGISPAVESAGYRPYRVDQVPHLERIDAKIIAAIRESHFVIADVTHQRPGVYYEAGFAQGLGLPVVWSVRKDELEKIHFDTRQFNHIVWESEQDLRSQLENFIVATIGRHAV